MNTAQLDLPERLLSKDEEAELSRTVEAGLYAQYLLDRGHPRHTRDELLDVVEAGRDARNTLWSCNLRLVQLLASGMAKRHELSSEELFQEGCMALYEAIMRFDAQLGNRFSTLAHTYIRRHLARVCAMRGGMALGPEVRSRHLAQLRETRLHYSTESEPSLRNLAARAGITHLQAAQASIVTVALEDASPQATAVEDDYEEILSSGLDFLNLMGPYGKYLRLRFGIGCEPLSRDELRRRFGPSLSSVARTESRALARARELLTSEQCRILEPCLLTAAS